MDVISSHFTYLIFYFYSSGNKDLHIMQNTVWCNNLSHTIITICTFNVIAGNTKYIYKFLKVFLCDKFICNLLNRIK